MWLAEFTRSRTQPAPRSDELAVLVEYHNAIVAVAVRNINVAVWGESHVVRLVHVRLVFAGLIQRSEGHKNLSVFTELAHRLRVCVDYPGIAGIVETNGVCIREHAFAPRLKELALCTVNLDWNLASVERPHISIRRHCDARH